MTGEAKTYEALRCRGSFIGCTDGRPVHPPHGGVGRQRWPSRRQRVPQYVFLPKGRVLPQGWNRWRGQETPSRGSVPSEHRHAWARKQLAFGVQVQVWLRRTGRGASPSRLVTSDPHPVPHIRHLTLATHRPGIRVSKPECLPYEQGPCVECTGGQICLGPDSPLLLCFAGTFMEVRLSDQLQGCSSCPQGETYRTSPAPRKVKARPAGRLSQILGRCPGVGEPHICQI